MAKHTFTLRPVDPGHIRQQLAEGKITWGRSLGMLFSRLVLFAFFQVLIALGFGLGGAADGWNQSIAWWPVTATVANLVSIAVLDRLLRSEGTRLLDLFRFNRPGLGKDLLAFLAVTLVSGPVGFIPMSVLSNWLFGDPQAGSALFMLPLPVWAAAVSLVLFPLTIAFAELPTYYGYVMPRLAQLSGKPWLALGAAVALLAAQHITLPLIFDARYLLMRLLMFLPFALWLGLALRWRPSLFPYLMIAHGLIDLATVYFVFSMSI